MPHVVREDGSLNDAAIALLHAVSSVDAELIRAARIRPSRSNWLRVPWYRYHRGGAITVGRTIWFTRLWWQLDGRGRRQSGIHLALAFAACARSRSLASSKAIWPEHCR